MADPKQPDARPILAVEARGIRRVFGGVTALDGADLLVESGTFFSLLGPSGCGKTTLLRVIAGLEHPDAGELRIHGAPTLGVPAHRRPVNTVFQSYALFPHLNVRENVAFGLRMKGVLGAECDRRVAAAMDLVQVGGLGARRPAELSGGQRQRVALARALVNEPQVLLLDEPLAALDVQLRQRIREELRDLQRRIGVTFILVTHDQEEALAVSDRIAVMRAGKVEQVGAGHELYARPRNRFVAEFLGACNVFNGTWSGRSPAGACVVRAGFGFVEVALEGGVPSGPIDGAVCFGIRPEHVVLESVPPSDVRGGDGTDSGYAGVVRECTYTGAMTQWVVGLGAETIRATRMNGAGAGVRLEPGSPVCVRFPGNAVIVLER